MISNPDGAVIREKESEYQKSKGEKVKVKHIVSGIYQSVYEPSYNYIISPYFDKSKDVSNNNYAGMIF